MASPTSASLAPNFRPSAPGRVPSSACSGRAPSGASTRPSARPRQARRAQALDLKLAYHPEAIVRFEREAYAAASLDHANIVAVFEAGAVGEQRYLAMEYLEGETLDVIIARGPTPAAQIVETALPLLSALAKVHGQGYIHRDLKPANVFLAQRAGGVEPKLLDFGLVKPDTAQGNAALTRKGALLGSPSYMSPEQAEARAIDTRSDLFSLGVVLWELATGRRLFGGRNVLEILHAVANAPVPAPSTVAGVPAAFDAAVLRALERDVNRRFQSAPEMARALLAVATPEVQARWAAEFGPPSALGEEFHTQREMPAARNVAAPTPIEAGDPEMEAATVPLGMGVGASTVPMEGAPPLPVISPAIAPVPALRPTPAVPSRPPAEPAAPADRTMWWRSPWCSAGGALGPPGRRSRSLR
ncbi:MAG: protein kinase [Polyangiales bacterium]